MNPQEDKNEEERSKIEEVRGSPMAVGSLEEIIDENHAIVSTSVGSANLIAILNFASHRISADSLLVQEPIRELRCRYLWTCVYNYYINIILIL